MGRDELFAVLQDRLDELEAGRAAYVEGPFFPLGSFELPVPPVLHALVCDVLEIGPPIVGEPTFIRLTQVAP